MKSRLLPIFAAALFAVMVFLPKAVFQGALDGLLMWYQVLFPTLFPFMVISSLLLGTGGLNLLCRFIAPPLCRLFRVSRYGSFAVLAGFLCGYPMGAKISADLLRKGLISSGEAAYLLSFCNNVSPAFLLNFVLWKGLGGAYPILPSILILLLSPFLVSLYTRRKYRMKEIPVFSAGDGDMGKISRPATPSLDGCIMDSFEAIVKVGMYVVLFSVLLSVMEEIPCDSTVRLCLSAPLEISNGVLILSEQLRSSPLCYPCVMSLTAFGGLCAAAQTGSMIREARIPFLPYMAQKLAAAAAASLLAILYIFLFQ